MLNSGDNKAKFRDFAYRATSLEHVTILYWLVFWLANGADKFLNRTDLGFFTWYGKHRAEQLETYFSSIDVSMESIGVILHAIGSWEVFLAIVFVACSVVLVSQRGSGISWRLWLLVRGAFFLSAVTFMVFSVFDVVVGDRFELLEHNVYLGLVVLSWFIFAYRVGRARGRQGQEQIHP